ncbi:hypothetical protein TURU_014100 [Turdus rufiventris]|nr:hypothetical protein TURU_014100 [Turdus rufiventris]
MLSFSLLKPGCPGLVLNLAPLPRAPGASLGGCLLNLQHQAWPEENSSLCAGQRTPEPFIQERAAFPSLPAAIEAECQLFPPFSQRRISRGCRNLPDVPDGHCQHKPALWKGWNCSQGRQRNCAEDEGAGGDPLAAPAVLASGNGRAGSQAGVSGMASVGAGDKDLRAHLHPVVFMIWRQHRNGAPGEHREEETNLGLLGKACKGMAFLTKPFVLPSAIHISSAELLEICT